MTTSDTGWQSFGDHEHRFEPPDIVHIRNLGAVSVADMQHMFEVVREAAGWVRGPVVATEAEARAFIEAVRQGTQGA